MLRKCHCFRIRGRGAATEHAATGSISGSYRGAGPDSSDV